MQVTGRLIKTGDVKNQADILAFPRLKSLARSPKFRYRYTVNMEDGVRISQNALALIRVYTVEDGSAKLSVIGSGLLPLYDKEMVSQEWNPYVTPRRLEHYTYFAMCI